MPKILISNVGYGDASSESLMFLKEHADVVENINRVRFDEAMFLEHTDADIIIAGTEKIPENFIRSAKSLKLIARVGVGVDNVDLEAAQQHKVSITYTPQAPSEAVPEFTLSLILNLIKGINQSDRGLAKGEWIRPMGRMLNSMTVGIIGAGKIGAAVIDLIKRVAPSSQVLFYDPYVDFNGNAEKVDFDALLKQSDLISLHMPLLPQTRNMIGEQEIKLMKDGVFLVNTSRGGIIDEVVLAKGLRSAKIAAAALDVFEKEPYSGELCSIETCLLTSHIGSMTTEVRALMERQVAEDVINFIEHRSLLRALENFNFGT